MNLMKKFILKLTGFSIAAEYLIGFWGKSG